MEANSLDFYREHARRYADVSHDFIQSVYTDVSHPAFRGDMDILDRLTELAPGPRGLDAGCGAGARDAYFLWSRGCDIHGVDAVAENIRVAAERHPEIADRLQVADLQEPLPFGDESFDFVMCNSVIQHIPPEVATDVTLRELVRVLRPGGVLQLMFKVGQGVETVFDRDYGVSRTFQLYDERMVLDLLVGYGCRLVEAESDDVLGGFIYMTDPKPMRYCAFYVVKTAGAPDQ